MTDPLPDWLSPIIVKELRQGLRSRAFVTLFAVLQIAMLFCLMAAAENSESSMGRQTASAFFWMVSGGMLLAALPLRGMNALSGEIKGNTLEILSLTPLTSWRIVMGKWAALFLQGVLMVITLLPYVVLRYFVGGIDLVGELRILGTMVAGCAVLTAFGVGLSPILHRTVGRILLGVGVVFAMQFLGSVLMALRFGRGTGIDPEFLILATLFLTPLVVLEAIELAVRLLAPVGENTAWRQRLLALAIIGVSGIIGWITGEAKVGTILAAILTAPVLLGALLGDAPLIPTLYEPPGFLKRNALFRRFSGLFLQPGLASGGAFVVLAVGLLFFFFGYRFDDGDVNRILCFAVGALIVPLALVRAMPKHRGGLYFLFQGAGLLLFFLCMLLGNDGLKLFSGLYPTTGLLVTLSGTVPDIARLILTLLVTGAAGVGLVIAAVRERAAISRIRVAEPAPEP